MKTTISILLCLLCQCLFSPSFAAPIPRTGPMHIEGRIESITWSPALFVRGKGVYVNGKWCPMSGSLGHDRTIPARYTIILQNTKVTTAPSADPSRSFKNGSTITLVINHPENDGTFRKGMHIRISDYTVSGDEGGNWYSCSHISIK